ncbi:hypothetical protein THAOC_14205, partial [Thalassiosira oceanica]
LAQLVERTTLNRVVVGSIPTLGVYFMHRVLVVGDRCELDERLLEIAFTNSGRDDDRETGANKHVPKSSREGCTDVVMGRRTN